MGAIFVSAARVCGKLLRSDQRDQHFEHRGHSSACVCRPPRMMRNERNHKCPLYDLGDAVAGTAAES